MKELSIKNEYASGLLELSRLATTELITASRLVSAKPVWLLFVSFCPTDGAALYEGSLQDSETTLVDTLIDAEAQYGQCKAQLHTPMYFNKGLYVTLTTNMKSITVQYLIDSP